jgi:hypothetical protein
VNSTKDALGTEIVARAYEREGDVRKAIRFYAQAKRFNNAIRLVKDYVVCDFVCAFG